MQDERRLYKRLITEKPVQFVLDSGDTLDATGMNISLGGMQVRCPRWVVSELTPSPERIARGKPADIRIRFQLVPQQGKPPVTIDVRCHAVALRRLSEEEYQMSLTYVFFDGTGYHDLEKFIDQNVT